MKFGIKKNKVLPLLGVFVLLIVLTTTNSKAAGPSGGPIADLYQKIDALQQQVTALQSKVTSLESELTPSPSATPSVTPTLTNTPTPTPSSPPVCQQISCGIGACHRVVQVCDGSNMCIAGAPSMEMCNGVDDDCDGIVDEAVPQNGQACGGGGIIVCTNGALECILN